MTGIDTLQFGKFLDTITLREYPGQIEQPQGQNGEVAMTITPGFRHDVFVSYVHADDAGPESEGWVSQLVGQLETVLRQRLGGTEPLDVFFDSRSVGANSELSDLLVAARSSALFLAVCSPSYIAREWPLQEMRAFVEEAADPSRLFVIECLPLDVDEKYPPPLDDHVRLQFWQPAGVRRVPIPCSPTTQPEDFRVLVHSLAADMRSRLLSLRVLPSRPTPRRTSRLDHESGRTAGEEPTQRKAILLAQPTDDVEDEWEQVRLFLAQFEDEVAVYPSACYPQGGEMFRAAFERDLSHADLFVQLLGRHAGRVPPDLPVGYTRQQWQSARHSEVEILQWRHPSLDLKAVSDPSHRELLDEPTVAAMGLEGFKRLVLERVREPAPKNGKALAATVFINADSRDLPVAKEIERECVRRALTTILPIGGPSSEENRRDLMDNLTDCDVLLFIYGDTEQAWIRSQLRLFSKVRPRRSTEPKLLAICNGPPPEKPEIGISLPNAHVIDCPEGWNVESIVALLGERVG